MDRVTVGRAAKLTGLSPKAVRLYEAKRLLPPAERTEAGYRLFTQDDLETLRFIRRAKALGLELADVKDVLDLQRGGAQPCGHVISLLDARIDEIDRTLADLHELRRTLAAVRAEAHEADSRDGDGVICRIIESPTGADPEARDSPR